MEALLRASRNETPEETPRAVVDTGTEEMKAGFASFDRGTGFISIDEVKSLCYALGLRVKRKEVRAMLAKKGKGDVAVTASLVEFIEDHGSDPWQVGL